MFVRRPDVINDNENNRKLAIVLSILFRTAYHSKFWNPSKQRMLKRGYNMIGKLEQNKYVDPRSMRTLYLKLEKVLHDYELWKKQKHT